jgi:hypothetical protein
MRHAVEEHLNEAPEVQPDTRLQIYDDGCQIFCVGPTATIYVDINTAQFWKDPERTIPATDDEARHAGVPVGEWHLKRRTLKLRQDTERHIQRLTAKHEQEQKPPEDLKAKTRRLVREHEKRVQAAADKALTRHLDAEGFVGYRTDIERRNIVV